ncbi:DUF1330 domain-containing protein [Marinobacter caseinilyticus]|uniref:DUF1330 domain-containing protein n=1 Tax=Marinobacter caseinilyticus TaxID=2692195 RepID=UPI00140B8FBE|nr:DUF1330 domain-containing protein [Marinobacter caseinilyticus]
MKACLVGHIRVRDPVLWQQYVDGVAISLEPFHGRVIFRGHLQRTLAGEQAHDRVVIVEFPDHDVLDAWFSSPDYQALIPLRDEAASVVITTYVA